MKITLLAFLLLHSSALADEVKLSGNLISFNKETGEVSLDIENTTDARIFIRVKDLEFPSYTIEGGGVVRGSSGGYIAPKLQEQRFMLLEKRQKGRITFLLRHYNDLGQKMTKINLIELTFTCNAYSQDLPDGGDIEFVVINRD